MDLLTVAEVCGLLRVSRSTLKRWIDRGLAPRPLRVGRTLRFRRADLDLFVQGGAHEASTIMDRHAAGEPVPLVRGCWAPDQGDVDPEHLAAAEAITDAEVDLSTLPGADMDLSTIPTADLSKIDLG